MLATWGGEDGNQIIKFNYHPGKTVVKMLWKKREKDYRFRGKGPKGN